jgi:hypothetical protein
MRSIPTLLTAAVVLFTPLQALAQVEAEPLLRGRVLVGDTLLTDGMVILHQVTDLSQGDLDSMNLGDDGAFSFRLPNVPDPSRDDLYFASIRHQGILYFGAAVTEALQLDSGYEIQTFDTLMVPFEGTELPIQRRNIFFEPDEDGSAWRVTDVFQIRNDADRTLVSELDGRVWSYPLPDGARNFTAGQGELSLDGTSFEDGVVSIRAAIAPGDRVFVMRYVVDDPFVTVPTPGVTDSLDLLVREPSPEVGVEGLTLVERVELEPGSTYRHYVGGDIVDSTVRLVELDVDGPLPVQWISVVLALLLSAAGLLALRNRAPSVGPTAVMDRSALLLQVARLDEEFERNPSPTSSEHKVYERHRSYLMRQLRGDS